ncbi:Eco57I restriction-modification methylase domain-containing protein [Thomasclavelia cocleata]|uniref:Eco57I restriction-modification methylase domain-containing protein n=1 Tax=Thomasclavelia cocleata TaxID=69824 RepID=UPI00262AA1BA|nr:Eco57I restriction-modification methylase domain-containing protein [Thomasclavelia cocleata]
MDTTVLDEIIVGRVEPHIYAFKTNTIPNYLKVGDTYRPVSDRLKEWRKYFPDLQKEFENKATVNDEIFFRDFAVHRYLERELNKNRLQKSDIKQDIYYSCEFFKDTNKQDIKNAIDDIIGSYQSTPNKYQYYKTADSMPVVTEYPSTGYWIPRPNQQEAIDNFCKAVNNGRTNLLMYAVMRFGKSFTSMCCAKEMPVSDGIKGAKIVLVVSAKADVKEEWKKTVQSADNFQEYKFLDSERLKEENSITNTLKEGKKVVIFLTLQDLQGSEIKKKHKEVFESQIDLLIVDETHFGARAQQYGKVLNPIKYEKDIKDKYTSKKTDADIGDYIESEIADEQVKQLNSKVKLHLSGTPYRILMGSEFSKEDIISFCQFSDIVKEQEKWDDENLLNDIGKNDKPIKEWDNPYYGFPQMVRFAFNPSRAAQERLQELKQSGVSYAFSALLKPKSVRKADNDDHKRFVFEKEVLELFEVIDGSKTDDNILSFLDYDKIKQGKMCQHIVCVLPYCASCDALEELIKNNKNKFKNLNKYEIINISGVDKFNLYKSVTDVKNKIKKCETENKKTLTLTVNRMLTGSTVEQWDTMIYLKDTSSPQEYDQAIFRLQNQYIRKMIDEKGDEIKYNMKPQTLLVDFDPHRMFVMQELKSQIYNANVEERGNLRLKERLEEDLRISPIIVFNKDKINRVEPNDILSAISQYSSNRSVVDEARDIPIDLSLLNVSEIKAEIEKQGKLGSNQGFTIDAVEGDDTDLDTSTSDSPENLQEPKNTPQEDDKTNSNKDIESIRNKFRTYYSRILFFSFLSKSNVSSLDNVISVIDNADNRRIAKNLDLQKNILILLKNNINVFVLRQLDYKIQNINKLANDLTIEPIERAIRAINKFNRLSASEVTTSQKVCEDMIALLPDESFTKLKEKDVVMLDIASKAGEYTFAICNRCKALNIDILAIKSSILSIPTSSVAYEFTRKVYEVLGLDTNCIAERFTSYDLLKVKKINKKVKNTDKIDYQKISDIILQNKKFNTIKLDAEIMKEGDKMKVEAVVGNPPYQESDGGAKASAKPIYQNFIEIARKLASNKISMITPTRWFAGGKGLDEFRNMMLNNTQIKILYDCLNPESFFPNTNIRGGVCYFLMDKQYNNSISNVKVITRTKDGKENINQRPLKTRNFDIFIREQKAVEILNKMLINPSIKMMEDYISPRKPFGLEGSFIKTKAFHKNRNDCANPVLCYGKSKIEGYVEKAEIRHNVDTIDKWKVFIPYANNIGTELNDDNLNSFIGEPNSICTETFLIIGHNLKLKKENCEIISKYLKTKFARFLHSLAKISQHATAKTYQFVPMQNFTNNSDIKWNKTIPEIDKQLYNKYGLSADEIEFIEQKIKPME